MSGLYRFFLIGIVGVCIIGTTGCTSFMKLGAISEIQGYRDDGRFEKALNEAENAAAFCSDPLFQAQIAFLKADCFERMGKTEDAKSLYRFLIEQCANSHYSYQARSRLNALEEEARKEQ